MISKALQRHSFQLKMENLCVLFILSHSNGILKTGFKGRFENNIQLQSELLNPH